MSPTPHTDASSGFGSTSQPFFDDALSDEVYGSGVYAAKGRHEVQNADDGIYPQSQGSDGDRTTFEVAIQTA